MRNRFHFWVFSLSIFAFVCLRSATPAAPVGGEWAGQHYGSNFETPWQTESAYLVDAIAWDLSEMAYYAKTGALLPAGGKGIPVEAVEVPGVTRQDLAYRVTVRLEGKSFTCTLPMKAGIWTPATYAPLTAALFTQLGLSPTWEKDPESLDLIFMLTEPKVEILTRADHAVSVGLKNDFTAPLRHEEAALLLGTFTARECDGMFFQCREDLCRITAHLAFAAALRADHPPSQEGRLAEAQLNELFKNQVTALKLVDLVADEPHTAAWKRALKMRITHDYRLFDHTSSNTLMEQLDYLRARSESLPGAKVLDTTVVTEDNGNLADWLRIMAENSPSVEIVHLYIERQLAMELNECNLAYFGEKRKNLTEQNLVPELNEAPTRCIVKAEDGSVQPVAIGWGLWAAFLQRHLCAAVTHSYTYQQTWFGGHNEGAKFRDTMDKFLGGLYLYPLVRRQESTEQGYYHSAQDDVMRFVHQEPQLVPAEAWNEICYPIKGLTLYIPPPHAFINEWHRPNPPPGTAYNFWPRRNQPSLNAAPDVGAVHSQMHRIAPYEEDIGSDWLYYTHTPETPEKIIELYGALAEFRPHLAAYISLVYGPNFPAREIWLKKGAILDAGLYANLAEIYRREGRDDEAAKAYVLFLAGEKDIVLIANECEWYMSYQETHGHSDEATTLADNALDAHSYLGIKAKGWLLESRHQYAEAFKVYNEAYDQYGNGHEVLGFLYREKDKVKDPAYEALYQTLLAQIFPHGLIPLGNPTAAPESGALVDKDWPAVRDAGLAPGDIITGAFGFQVDRWQTYLDLRQVFGHQNVQFHVWRKDHYLDTPPMPFGFLFRVDFPDYRKPDYAGARRRSLLLHHRHDEVEVANPLQGLLLPAAALLAAASLVVNVRLRRRVNAAVPPLPGAPPPLAPGLWPTRRTLASDQKRRAMIRDWLFVAALVAVAAALVLRLTAS